MQKITLLNTTFICPFMQIKLEGTCSLASCPYHTTEVESGCMWEYISAKKSISITELSIIMQKDVKYIINVLKSAKLKIIKYVVYHKLVTNVPNIKDCYKCGKAYNLKKEKNNYVCKDMCIDMCIDIKLMPIIRNIEKTYNKPISYILSTLASLINLSTISKVLKLSNKLTKQLYITVYGDASLFSRHKDLKTKTFKRRNKKIALRTVFGKRNKNLSFYVINNNIKNFKI